jgi:O-antigen ligase
MQNYHINWQSMLENSSKIAAIATAAALPISTSATSILFILTPVLYFAAGNWREKLNKVLQNPIAQIMLMLFALFLLGLLYTAAPMHDALRMVVRYDKLFFGAFMFPLFTEERVRTYAINAFIIAIVVMLVASYMKAAGWINYEQFLGPIEVFRGHIEYNFLLAFSAYLILFKINFRQPFFWLWGLLLIAILYAMFFMSIGRSGYFVFLGLLVLFFIQKFKWRGVLIALISVGLVCSAALMFSGVFKQRMQQIISDVRTYQVSDQTSVGLRLTFYKNSVLLFQAHPIIGTGTGSFAYDYANIKPQPTILTRNPHNEYLNFLVQFGLIGFALIILFFAAQFYYSFSLPKDLRWMAQAVVLAIVLGNFANSC